MKIKIIFIHIYLRYCNIPKVYSSNGSNISDYIDSALYQISLEQVPRAENVRKR